MRALAIVSAVLALLLFARALGSKENPAKVLSYLPTNDFAASGPAEHFVGKKLFDYMNGGAELYLAYGFIDLGAREYQSDTAKAAVAIYQMSNPEGAFGLYLTAANGQLMKLAGVPAMLSPDMLSFFKGSFHVRVVAKSVATAEKNKEFLISLAKRVASKLPGEAKPPSEASLLPKGSTTGSLRYLPNPQTAQTIWFNGEGEILLSKQATAYTAFYPIDQGDLQLTRASYPSSSQARSACRGLARLLKLKHKEQEHACTASGKDSDDLAHFVQAKGGVLRWIGGAPDVTVAETWIGKIR